MDPQARVRLVLLLTAALGLYLLGNASVPLMDRDEPRYAQCSRQMLQSGDWVVPRLYDDIRAKKPPLIYWCQASVMAVIGDTAFAARLPSVLAIFATACLLAKCVWKSAGPKLALWTTLVFCSSALVMVAAKSSMTDAVLLLWIVIAQICLYVIWRGDRSWRVVITLAIAVALGLLTKGLIAGVELATIAALALMRWRWGPVDAVLHDHSGAWSPDGSSTLWYARIAPPPAMLRKRKIHFTKTQVLQIITAILIVLGITMPWFILVHHRSPEFLAAMRNEAQGHLTRDMEGHAGYPGIHLVMIWGDFFPWSLLLPAAIAVGWKQRMESRTRFALAAVVGPWLMAEFAIRTKLPQYMLPTIPALSFLTASAIVHGLGDKYHGFTARPFVRAASLWAGVVIVIGLLPWLAVLRFRPLPWVAMTLISLGAIAWAVLVVRGLQKGRAAEGIAGLGIGMICLTALLYGVYFPRAEFLRLSILAADVLKTEGATKPGDAIMTDYKEPSLAFYQGGTIRERLSPTITKGHYDQWAPWIVMTRDVWNRSSPEIRAHLEIVADFHGLSVADGMRDVNVMVLRRK